MSDKTNREKWGTRRLIYIKYGAPIWALTFLLIWFPWSYDNQFIIFLHYVISICLFDTMLTLVILVWMALLPELTSDIDERNKVNFLVLVIGLIGVLPFLIITAGMNTLSFDFQFIMIIIAILSTLCLIIVARGVKERSEFKEDEVFPLMRSIKETVKLKSYRWYVVYNFCGTFLGSISLSYVFIYALILGEASDLAILGFLAIYIFVGYSSNMHCIKLREKKSMREIILKYGKMKVIGTLVIFVLVLIPGTEVLLWIGMIWNMWYGGYLVFNVPLMYLSIDEDEAKHGTRREGMFLGMNALITKPAQSLGPIIATIILVNFEYVTDAPRGAQPASALLGIKMLFLLVPAIVTAISLFFMYKYPLYGETLKELKDKVEIIHKEKIEKAKQVIN